MDKVKCMTENCPEELYLPSKSVDSPLMHVLRSGWRLTTSKRTFCPEHKSDSQK